MIPSNGFPDTAKADLQSIYDPLFEEKEIRMDVLRLDKIHTIISGNKWFKLKHYLKAAQDQHKKGIISFGGAYSNHLLATAFACHQAGLSSIGIVRGEEPASYSPTLQDLQRYGMQLQFYSRYEYGREDLLLKLQQWNPGFLIVEEGGRGQPGIRGAEEILHLVPLKQYTHIICAVGTATMFTGILNAALSKQQVVGVLCLKIDAVNNELVRYIHQNSSSRNFCLRYEFHLGGYAKKNDQLIKFMNMLYHQHGVPTDFVYTGKLFYAAMKLIEQDYFPRHAHILMIHSGGLQGNRSLTPGTLDFS